MLIGVRIPGGIPAAAVAHGRFIAPASFGGGTGSQRFQAYAQSLFDPFDGLFVHHDIINRDIGNIMAVFMPGDGNFPASGNRVYFLAGF